MASKLQGHSTLENYRPELEDFCQRGKENNPLASSPKKKYNPLNQQEENMKMLTLNIAESLKNVCPESILFSAAPKPDIDFVTDLKQQTDEVTENLCSIYDWISTSANVENFFCKFICPHVKRKNTKN